MLPTIGCPDNGGGRMRLLLVEDDRRIAQSVAVFLRQSGFAVDIAPTGEEGLRMARTTGYDAAVVDIMLPGISGLEMCQALRKDGSRLPVIMATARDAVEDRINGLETGADDYLVKPYALGELAARVRAVLRRPRALVPVVLSVGDLELRGDTRRARRAMREIELTTKEYMVLEFLMRHAGEVVTREDLATHAWDERYDPSSNVIDVYIARLRRKLDGEGEPPLLTTIRGSGYRISAVES
ncbi:MAG: response regulator transcription factor [Gemmatimonadota bacterium]